VEQFLKYKSKIFVPSLANLLFLVLFLSLSLSSVGFLLSDADTGWHIRAGEFILETGSVPRHDIFSFAHPSPDWLNHQWLSEVIMALIHKSLGLTGIVIFFALLISLTYSMLFKLIQKEEGNIFLAAFIILFTIASSLFHWFARPHLFTLLFFVFGYSILEDYQYRNINRLYFFPPLILFWVNLHGGFISGFILMFIYLVGNLIKLIVGVGTKELYKQKTKGLTLTILVCLFVSMINPYGLTTLVYPFKLISQKLIMDNMGEFQSPNFHLPVLLPSKYFLLSMIFIIGILRKNLNIIEILLIVLFTNMAFFSVRFIPLLCIVSSPILVRNGEWILNRMDSRFVHGLQRKSKDICSVDVSAKGYLWLVAGILVIVMATAGNRIEHQFDENRKPVEAVKFLKRVPLQGNMFNDDEFGDYIIYSAYPQYRVFIDSRVDMHGSQKLKDYLTMVYFRPGWEKIVEKYNINWIIVSSDSILSRYLLERNDWKLIYADKVARIFMKNVQANEDILRRYGSVKSVTVAKEKEE
jgi:hypothetical protein